jgi:hypothetical protein
MRSHSRFKLRDVTRATKAVRAAGLEIARVEVAKDGSIVVVPGRPPEATTGKASDDLDNWMQAHARSTEGH